MSTIAVLSLSNRKGVSQNARSLALILGGSLFIALCSKIAVPLYFSPVPFTFQTLAVALIAAHLGKVRGSLAIALYLFEGGLGLPFFAGASCGLASLFGPTGGYLIGFLPAAYLIGRVLEKRPVCGIAYRFFAFTLGTLVIWVCGLLQLSLFTGFDAALKLGLYPFILGDFLKIAAATLLTRRG